MHHAFLDRYSDLKSPVHLFDARLKAITCFLFVVCIASLPIDRFVSLFIFMAILLATWTISNLPVPYLAKRLTVLMPFILIMSISMAWTHRLAFGGDALKSFFFTLLRAMAAIIAITILTSTTPFSTLVDALHRLKVPATILSLMSFLYRFAYVLVDEFEKLNIGRRSRNFGPGLKLAWKSRAWMLGTFLIRSMERSERVYTAMAARGFAGDVREGNSHMPFDPKEVWFSAFAILAIILIRIGVTR